MTLGDIVKDYRIKHNISMDTFAKRSNLSKGYISMLEKNKNPRNGKTITPSIDTIKNISNAIGININELLDMIDDEQEFILDDRKNSYEGVFLSDYNYKLMLDRLQKAMDEQELTIKKLAQLAAVPYGTLYKVFSGETKDPSINMIIRVAGILNVTADYLIYGNNAKSYTQIKKIPLVGTVACGDPIYAEENILDYIHVNISDNVDFALYAKGDSMNNCKIDNGDTIYIKKQPIVNNGEIALVLVDDSATIKRFFDYGDKIVLRPDSKNPEHKEQIYNKCDHNIIVQGKVIFIKTFVN